jgi:methionine synthase II (cobalamin-independent)
MATSVRLPGFIRDCQSLITNELQFADAWEALKQEYAAMQANGIQITDADLTEIGVNTQQFLAALAAMQEVVDYVHTPVRAAKLYRVRR